MKNNLKLIARGALLGYAIAMALFCLFAIPASMFLPYWITICLYGMGLGIVTELSFSARSFREKIAIYLLGIFLCPPLFAFELSIIFDSLPLDNLSSVFGFFLLLLILPILAVSGLFYFKKANFLEIFSYFAGYITVLIAFAFGFLLALNFQMVFRGAIGIIFWAILSFASSSLSVLLSKKIILALTNFKETEKENL